MLNYEMENLDVTKIIMRVFLDLVEKSQPKCIEKMMKKENKKRLTYLTLNVENKNCKELREIAKLNGVKLGNGVVKKDIVAAINADIAQKRIIWGI